MTTTPRVTWEKSSYSNGDGGACVEFTRSLATEHLVPVRDSKKPQGPALIFDTTAWETFVQAAADGEFGTV
jgi:Domain of unknown function (DUF397)